MNDSIAKRKNWLFSNILFGAFTVSFLLLLVACGGSGNEMPPVNQQPTADAGHDSTVVVDSNVILDGSNSRDPDGGTLTYRWVFLSKPASSSATLSNATSVSSGFVADKAGAYVIQLIVNDGDIDSAGSEIVVTATVQNIPPIADAGDDQEVAVGVMVSLNGNGSSGDALIYQWTLTSKPTGSSANLLNDNQANPGFTADIAGNYIVQLIVNDGSVGSAPDAVTITASTQNIRPVAVAGEDKIVKIGESVSLDGSASYDPNGDSLIYRWAVIDPDGLRTAGMFRRATINFTPAEPGDYILELFVRDDGAGELKDIDEVRVTAASRVIELTWPANADNPAGYVVFAGPKGGAADKQVRVMVRGDRRWDPSSPGLTLGWETVLRAANLPLGATEVCLAIRAYNSFGLSPQSLTSCFVKPS